MKRYSVLILLFLAACAVQVPQLPERQVYANRETALALTPSPTLTPTATVRPAPTATTAATVAATPTRAVATPSVTRAASVSSTVATTLTTSPQPGTPSATPGFQLSDLSLCNQSFGPPDAGSFSGRLQSVEVRQFPSWDQLTLVFSRLSGSLHGTAGCIRRSQWEQMTGLNAIADTQVAIDLSDWAHDSLFAASPISDTRPISTNGVLSGITFVATQQASRGLTVGIGTRDALPFHVRTASNPDRVIVEVRRDTQGVDKNDPLATAGGDVDPPAPPIFFLQNYDAWRWYKGQASPVAKTDELEYALAVSPDHETLAVCRAPAGTDPESLPYRTRGTLWVLRADGSNARQLADTGGCAEPTFARDGKTIAFTTNTAAVEPPQLAVWTVPVVVGEATSATPFRDEWSRYAPQWLPDGRLLYRGRDDAGQNILFLRGDDRREREVSAALLTGSQYRGVGDYVVNDAGDTIALEAFRMDKPGADLVILKVDGTFVAADSRGYWQRPLTYARDGFLYLTTECASGVIQQYTLRLHHGATADDVTTGTSTGALGDVVAIDNALVYSRVDVPLTAPRGARPTAIADSPVSVWVMSKDSKARRELYRSPVAISEMSIR